MIKLLLVFISIIKLLFEFLFFSPAEIHLKYAICFSENLIMYNLVKEKMEKAKKFKIPIVVDINFGKNWAEAH